jgi:sugar phosphate isomerase/epimerase
MKLSCLPVSYFAQIIGGEMSIRDWAHQGAEVGLDAIDLSILFVKERSAAYLHKLREEIEGAGIRVAMVTTYPDFTHPDAAQREREVAQSREDIATAAHLGAELVRVTAGQAHPATGREEGIAWAVEGLTKVLGAREEHGLTLVLENHAKPGAWQYVDFCHPTDIFLEIVERTAGTALGVNWDTANTLAFGDDPLPVLEKVLDRVISVHAADTAMRGELKPVLLGTGLVPFREMFNMLKRAGFDGWICMEEASFQGKAGVETAARFIRRTWEEA